MDFDVVKSSRGRPAKTSREDILDAACAQLKENPFEELSLSALARSMSLTPMALYRYFDDKNDLQQAIAERLMKTFVIDLDGCTDSQMKLRRWAMGLWHGFHDNPQLIHYMGWRGHIAGAWISQIAMLAGVLKEAGLAGADLAMAMKWISFSVIGIIHIAVIRTHRQVQLESTDIMPNDALAAANFTPILAELAGIDEQALFEHHVAQIIARLETILPR